MRTVARWIGGLWLGAMFLAIMVIGFIEWGRPGHMGVIIPVRGGYGEIYLLVLLGMPGAALLAWGERGKNKPDA